MTITLRPAHASELPALTQLCLRSKAHWGYDAAFMKACEDELTLTPEDLNTPLIVAADNATPIGTAQVAPVGQDAELHFFFVDPPYIGHGVGRQLWDWAIMAAKDLNARRLLIDADPGAAPFYKRMGAVQIGETPSASIPGRVLPQLAYTL